MLSSSNSALGKCKLAAHLFRHVFKVSFRLLRQPGGMNRVINKRAIKTLVEVDGFTI